jgi:hypothetical protein
MRNISLWAIIWTEPGEHGHGVGVSLLSGFVGPEIEKLAHLRFRRWGRVGMGLDWELLSLGKFPDGAVSQSPQGNRRAENNDLYFSSQHFL